MDHNLEDSLTMETIENMEFDHSGVVVNQEDITLEESEASAIPMDMDTVEEQPILLNTGSEEVIVSDFMGDQFGFQEYSMQGENSSGANITIGSNQLGDLSVSNEQVIDLKYADCGSKATTSQPSIITIKAVTQRSVKKAPTTASYPRQVAIAPKPVKGAPNIQYAIAPKPVALVMNKNTANLSKVVPMKNPVGGVKGNSVLAQIGKQLVMVPAGPGGQKLKLTGILPAGSADSNIQFVRCSSESQAQLIANKGGKPVRSKIILQGQSNADISNQPAIITKIMPSNQARYVMQQKTVPISIGGSKVVLTTPSKQSVKVAPKKQIISIKTQSPQVVTSQANVQTKKVVISANPTQNVIVKGAGVKTSAQVTKDNTAIQGQHTQLHPINVPGKGIQYIKLVTNQSAIQKPAPKTQTLSMSGKNFVLTDSKGNIIQMTSEKVSGQPPPLLVTATTAASTKVATKTKKLVRIAPISQKSDTPSAKAREASKMAYCVQPKPVRASQSLLMPRESVLTGTSVSLEEFNEMVDQNNLNTFGELPGDDAVGETVQDASIVEEEPKEAQIQEHLIDVKPTLASLISDAVAGEESIHEMIHMEEIEIEYENTPQKQERFIEDENTNSMEYESNNEKSNENLIIVPPIHQPPNTTEDDENMYQDDTNNSMDDNSKMQITGSVETDVISYLSPEMEQGYSDTVFMFDGNNETPAGLRPRKACNCTKSQCLKLYCDCFANGEFCNKCNCNNCHNNLENEELRQKAIRACLERNPNAFRPKIGKAKSGGPDVMRRHNKGCNCKRSGCLKNYCECYEAKIACTLMCKCVGCRNIEETLERRRDAIRVRDKLSVQIQPCSFMTPEVIEAVAQCMLATVTEGREDANCSDNPDAVEGILLEFSRCMADIISASHQA